MLVGLDISLVHLKKAHLRVPHACLICGDAEHLPFREAIFDVTFCLDTLEHLPNPQKSIRDLESITKTGGKLVISVPDDRNLAIARFFTFKYPLFLPGHIAKFKNERLLNMFNRSSVTSIRKMPFTLLPVDYLFLFKKLK